MDKTGQEHGQIRRRPEKAKGGHGDLGTRRCGDRGVTREGVECRVSGLACRVSGLARFTLQAEIAIGIGAGIGTLFTVSSHPDTRHSPPEPPFPHGALIPSLSRASSSPPVVSNGVAPVPRQGGRILDLGGSGATRTVARMRIAALSTELLDTTQKLV